MDRCLSDIFYIHFFNNSYSTEDNKHISLDCNNYLVLLLLFMFFLFEKSILVNLKNENTIHVNNY